MKGDTIYHVKFKVTSYDKKGKVLKSINFDTVSTDPCEEGILNDWLLSRRFARKFGDKHNGLKVTNIEILTELGDALA